MSRPNAHATTTGLEHAVSVASDTTTSTSLHDLTEDVLKEANQPAALEANDAVDDAQAASEPDPTTADSHTRPKRFARLRGLSWEVFFAYRVLPAIAILLALAAAYLRWHDSSAHQAQQAAEQSTHAAAESTSAILSYKPDTVEQDLVAASGRLTGSFKNDYMSLIHDVVIPGAKQKHISAVATVPATAPVSATDTHAVVLVFVDQTTTIGNDAPSSTASSVRVTLDKVGDKWLISKFDPV